ncbi:hypothetical protein HMPREF9318_00963 [Streptococcus urinalis FB127-CNA-2]|nr:hypothetical protein [Streptococcus urinalis]EKS21009.1 hypothetical protein HMPREF9318_00963 [Streptococcus urinalis FB127-CNA-2]VEF31018.1 signal peptide [Streptococcus urinalis]
MKKLLQRKSIKIVAIVTAIIAVLLIAWGGFYYSKANQMNRFINAYKKSNGDTFENIKEYLVWSDTKKQVTNDEAQFANYKHLTSSQADTLKTELKLAQSGDDRYMVSVGRRFFIFPDYRVAIKPISLTLKTNVPNVDILLNQKKVTTSNSEDFSTKVNHIPKANYTAKLSGQYKNQAIEVSKDFDGENTTLDLTVTFKNFTVTSNLGEGELYFDKTRIGSLKEGQYQVKEYPLTDSAKAYVEKNFSDGSLLSEKKDISSIDDNATVSLDATNLLNNETAGQQLVTIFNQLIQYVNSGQDAANIESIFEGGTSNPFYIGLKDSVKSRMSTDSRKASSFNIPNINLTSLTQIGKNSYQVNFTAVYDFFYDKATDSEKGTIGHVVQDISGQLVLKKSGQSYIVTQKGQQELNVTKEDNQVKAESVFPESLIGTWTGTQNELEVEMTFAKDGTITRKIHQKDGKIPDETKTAKVTSLEDKGNHNYLYHYDSCTDTSAFITSGIGGAGVKYAYGIQINDQKIKIIIWQTSINSDFNYDKPMTGPELSKK